MGWHVADSEEKWCLGIRDWVLYLTMEEKGERESSEQRERERKRVRERERERERGKDRGCEQKKLLRAVINNRKMTSGFKI